MVWWCNIALGFSGVYRVMGGWGDNGPARPSTDAYRNSKFWDNIKKDKEVNKDEKAESGRGKDVHDRKGNGAK